MYGAARHFRNWEKDAMDWTITKKSVQDMQVAPPGYPES